MGQANAPDSIIDYLNVPDTFVTGIHHFEMAGPGVVRVVYYAQQIIDGQTEIVVAQRIVMPVTAITAGREKAAQFLQENSPGVRAECRGCRDLN